MTSTSRRHFCTYTCHAVTLASLATFIQACGGSPSGPSDSVPALPTISASASLGAITLTIDAAPPLAAAGGAALVQTIGTVVKGPAVQPLRQFATRFSGSTLTITLA